MEQYTWVIWLIFSVVLIVAEIFTLGFFLFWFGIGALGAALVGLFGFGLTWQFLTFAIVSTVFTIMSRTLFSKYLVKSGDEVKMGADSLPGMVGTVTSASHGALNAAAVKVYGSEWTAFPVDEELQLTEGEKVEVVSVKGSSIYVRPVRKEIPGWKQD